MAINSFGNFVFHDIATENILACVLLEVSNEVAFSTLWEISGELREFSRVDGDMTHIYYSDISRDSVIGVALSLHNYFELTNNGIRSKGDSSAFFQLLKHNTSHHATDRISSCIKQTLYT